MVWTDGEMLQMRDQIKDIEYFNGFLQEEQARITRFSDKLANGEVKPERQLPVKTKIHDLKLGILTARYSRGDELSALEGEYAELLKSWEGVWESDHYNKNLKMISLGVLFGGDPVIAKAVNAMLKEAKVDDWLLSFLLCAWMGSEIKNKDGDLLFPADFSLLQKAALAHNGRESLQEYLSCWYREDCGCYEAHKSSQKIYYGYWSFEAGAVAKILNIDDAGMERTPYYPYDLVHYKQTKYGRLF